MYGAVTTDSIGACPGGTLSNLGVGASAAGTFNTTAGTDSGWLASQGEGVSSGLAANTHLINETSDDTVAAGLELAHAVSRSTGLPVRFWAMLAHLAEDPSAFSPLPWLPLTRQITTPLEPRPHGLRRRSSIV